MPVNTTTKGLDALLSTTLEKVRPVMADNIFKGNPLLFLLYDKRQVDDGGALIHEPLLYAESTNVKWLATGYTPLDTTAQEGITAATYEWRTISGTISISGDELRKNSGSAAVLNLLKAKAAQCEMTLRQNVNQQLLQVASAKPAGSILGLDEIVDDADPVATIVGGIDPATYTWWRNTTRDDGGTAWSVGLGRLYTLLSEGRAHPDLGITTKTLYGDLEGRMSGQIRATSTKFNDFGFENILWKGMPIVPDFFCQANLFYMVNTDYLRLHVHRDADFKIDPFQRPTNQDAIVAPILWMGQLTTNNRRFHGVETDADAFASW